MFNPTSWYWLVAGIENKLWSSAEAAYVSNRNPAFKAWVERGNIPTKIASEELLQQVFIDQYPAGWPGLKEKARLKELDIYLPRSLEDHWEATGFDVAKLHPRNRDILEEKKALRARLLAGQGLKTTSPSE